MSGTTPAGAESPARTAAGAGFAQEMELNTAVKRGSAIAIAASIN
jgi:hypothetical protein